MLKRCFIHLLGIEAGRALRRRLLGLVAWWGNIIASQSYILYDMAQQKLKRRIHSRVLSNGDLSHLDIAFVVPCPEPGSGGYRNICRAARQLRELGHSVTLYYMDSFWSPSAVRRRIRKWYFDLGDISSSGMINECMNMMFVSRLGGKQHTWCSAIPKNSVSHVILFRISSQCFIP